MSLSRRSFLASTGIASIAAALPPAKKIPVGLELYSVRDALTKNLMGTVRDVAKMGYEVVEFYSPYMKWTPDYAKQVRALLDEVGLKCHSTHNGSESLTGDGLKKAIELNQIIGSKYIILASAGTPENLDAWKSVAAKLADAQQTLTPLGMATGYHNHAIEFRAMNGQKPIDLIAANTPKEVVMQLDVGHCVEAGGNPAGFIRANAGRIRSIHCKDYGIGKAPLLQHTETVSPDGKSTGAGANIQSGVDRERGFKVLIGEGDVQWRPVIDAAESVGGVEYYLIEQEGSRFSEMETAERSLANWKRARSAF